MRHLPSVLLLMTLVCSRIHAAPSENPLLLYQGTWHVTRKSAGANAKPDELKNQCALVGKFFACQQTVNGAVTALLIFVTTNQPGHYATQNVLPEGRATGRGDLEISGNRWVFTSIWNQGSKTTRYRTTNVFTDKNHIHFEQEESSDGVHWETKDSGDDVRISATAR
jgi:hypothetical protein